MCGIVGYVTSKNKVDYEKYFRQALLVDMIRGFDSTGVVVGTKNTCKVHKKAVNSHDFLDMRSANKVLDRLSINQAAFMIGHNRAATVGNIVAENAHPFTHGSITGVHNGTLRKYHNLDKDKDFSTDSEALYYNLSARESVEDTLCDVEGAYALVWHDSDTKTINLIRNSERPLAIAKVKNEDTVLWASEAGMLSWIASRNGLQLESITVPKPNVLITFDLDSDEVAKYKAVQLDVVSNYPTYSYGNNTRGYSRREESTTYGIVTASSPEPQREKAQIDFNKKYEVIVGEFVPYRNSQTGTGEIECYMVDAPYLTVSVHAATPQMYDDYMNCNNEVAVVTITSVNTSSKFHTAVGTFCPAKEGNCKGEKKPRNAGGEPCEYIGPHNSLISLSDMQRLCNQGCFMCHESIGFDQYDEVDWIESSPVCAYCLNEEYKNVH